MIFPQFVYIGMSVFTNYAGKKTKRPRFNQPSSKTSLYLFCDMPYHISYYLFLDDGIQRLHKNASLNLHLTESYQQIHKPVQKL